MLASITFLLAAGHIREDDDLVLVLQGLSSGQAEAIADWFAIATQGPVKLRFMAPPIEFRDITRWPEDVTIEAEGQSKIRGSFLSKKE